MKKVIENYGGAILLYLVIFFGILAISSRISGVNNSDNYKVNIAINK